MDMNKLMQYVEGNEGRRLHTYLDSVGIPTIGVGFNLKRADAPAKISGLGLNYSFVLSGAQDLTDDQVNQLFAADAQNAMHDATTLFPNFEQLDETRQIVLTDLIFNLGLKGLATFVRFVGAIKAANWNDAAQDLQESKWFTQVGHRGVRNVNSLKTGVLQPLA